MEPAAVTVGSVSKSQDVQFFNQTMQSKRKMGYMTRKNANRQIIFCPSLNLGGRWMERAGFQIGQQVKVTVQNAGTPAAKIIIEQ